MPRTYDPGRPAPLVLCLHGAGGEARHRIDALRGEATRTGAILVAPDSFGSTWDIIRGRLGPDVTRIDRALQTAFAALAVDPARVVIEGFSDGASYALSLGLDNGNLFHRILAFSPGFMQPAAPVGMPRIFVSHGTLDEVLPVSCSRRIVSRLEQSGYSVLYREFRGGHSVPPKILSEAMSLLAA